MKSKLIIGFALMATFFGSCQKNQNTTTGNPFVSLAMTSSPENATVTKINNSIWQILLPKSFAYPPPPTLLDSAGNTVTITSAWVNFEQIEFKYEEAASGSEVDGDSVEFNSIFAVDLLSNTPQAFVSGNINVSQMRRVKLKLARVSSLPVGAPADFMGKSIYLSGTVNGHAFTYSTQDETVIEIAGPTLIAAVENSTLLIELQLANLIKRTNLSTITSTTNINDSNKVSVSNPCPNIENGASDLFTCFYIGLEKESDFGRDDDGDYILDPDEDSVKN